MLPDLEIFNKKQIQEIGKRYKAENAMLKKQIQLEEALEGMKDTVFENILRDVFKDDTQSSNDITKPSASLDEIEEGQFRVEEDMIMSGMDLNNKVVPLLGDSINLVQIEKMTKEDLVNESENFRKKVKDDYKGIRSQFRDAINKIRFDEMDTISSMRAQTAQGFIGDPYADMKAEIKKLDEEQKRNRKVRFGFITSRSLDGNSDDEEQEQLSNHSEDIGKENERLLDFNEDLDLRDSKKESARKPARNSLSRKSDKKKSLNNDFRSSAGFASQSAYHDLNTDQSIKVRKGKMRVESARRNKKLPPTMNKDKLNELREMKINEEKVSFPN